MKSLDSTRNPVNKKSRGEFSVSIFFCDGTHDFQCRHVPADQAMSNALTIIGTHGAQIGVITSVAVIDPSDFTVFEWTHAHGVTFPPQTKVRGRGAGG